MPVARPDRAIPSRKKAARNADVEAATRKESKLKRKWLEKKNADVVKRARRAAVLEKLAQHALSPEQRALLKRTSDIGVQERVRQPIADDDAPASSPLSTPSSSSSRKPRAAADTSRARLVPITKPQESSSDDDDVQHNAHDTVVAPVVVPVAAPVTAPPAKAPPAKTPPQAPLPQAPRAQALPTTPVVVVRPSRPADIAAARLNLPVCGMEQEIMETVRAHDIVILCGETGSGKSTQVPQFLVEAGFGCTQSALHSGMIAMCQPRRVAAISLAHRVAQELGVGLSRHGGDEGDRAGVDAASLRGCVGYQVRHDVASVGTATRVKFVTEGVLLREATEDVLLRKYSCVVLDEAHERGVNVDLLLGLLSRVVPLREAMHAAGEDGVLPLKLIVMSATLAVQDFADNARLAWRAPVVRVDARQFPVTPHFAKRTVRDEELLQATLRKVAAVHRKLPPGGVLVFLTGQRDIEWFVAELRAKFGKGARRAAAPLPPVDDGVVIASGLEGDDASEVGDPKAESENDYDVDAAAVETGAPGEHDADDAQEGDKDDYSVATSDGEVDDDDAPETAAGPVHAVALYSKLSVARQQACFRAPPAGSRLVVVATNVAETSLTIPGIRYVVDCGKVKRKVFEAGACTMRTGWTSRASADQRMGRAGRTGPGHCYRLYSSAVYMQQMEAATAPEVAAVPVDDLVLYMKSMGIASLADFPFPSPPPPASVARAVARLQRLGALDAEQRTTPLGATMARFPVAFRWSKMLVVAGLEPRFQGLLAHVVAIAAHLSLSPPFAQTPAEGAHTGDADTLRRGDCSSDALSLLRAAGAFAHADAKPGAGAALCVRLMLDEKTMREAAALRAQLAGVFAKVFGKPVGGTGPLRPVSFEEEALLRQAVATGLMDCVARRMDSTRARNVCASEGAVFPPRQACDWPMETCDGQVVRLHPLSVVARSPAPREWVVFTSTSANSRIEGVTAVEPSWLAALAQGGTQVKTSEPLDVPEPAYVPEKDAVMCSVRPSFGSVQWPLPIERVPAPQPHAWFARALLEGKVFAGWPQAKMLAAPAAHASRAPNNARVATLVGALERSGVANKHELVAAWKSKPALFVDELRAWATKEARAEWDQALSALIQRVTR